MSGTQIIVRGDVVRAEANRLSIGLHRFLYLALVFERGAQITMPFGEVWPKCKGSPVTFDGRIQIVPAAKGIAEVAMGIRIL